MAIRQITKITEDTFTIDTFALIDLPLQLTSADITIAWHSLDGDDVQLMFNGDVMENLKSKRWKNWIWHADPKQVLSGARREKKEFSKQLSKGIHYIEFWADKTPTLHNVTLNLGDYTPKRVPTVNDLKWTGGVFIRSRHKNTFRALFYVCK